MTSLLDILSSPVGGRGKEKGRKMDGKRREEEQRAEKRREEERS